MSMPMPPRWMERPSTDCPNRGASFFDSGSGPGDLLAEMLPGRAAGLLAAVGEKDGIGLGDCLAQRRPRGLPPVNIHAGFSDPAGAIRRDGEQVRRQGVLDSEQFLEKGYSAAGTVAGCRRRVGHQHQEHRAGFRQLVERAAGIVKIVHTRGYATRRGRRANWGYVV